MRIITDIYKQNGLKIDEVISGYSDGRGIEWLLNKRIDSLLKLGFVKKEKQSLVIYSNFKTKIVIISEFYKKLIKIGKGGE